MAVEADGNQHVDLQQLVVRLPSKLCRSMVRCLNAWEEATQLCCRSELVLGAVVKLQACCRAWLVRRTLKTSHPVALAQSADDDENLGSEDMAAIQAAALTIQRVARGAISRSSAHRMNEQKTAAMTKQVTMMVGNQSARRFVGAYTLLLLGQNMANKEFQFSMQEVLRETMYNLIQECVHEEFDVFSVPVQYLTKSEQP